MSTHQGLAQEQTEEGAASASFHLRLYVAGQTPKSILAIKNLRRICDEHLVGRCTVEVVDLNEQPQRAKGDQILAIPTLIRQIPAPFKRIIGDLSNVDRVLLGLDILDLDGKKVL